MKITFRLTTSYLKKNVDLVSHLGQYGTDLFLVLHEKPNQFHYHGLLDINTCPKTFRKHLNNCLCPEAMKTCPKGMRPVSVSDKIDDCNRYKAYCCYRGGHPITNIVVNDDLQELKLIHDSIVPKERKTVLKTEADLKHLRTLIPIGTEMSDVVKKITQYYLDNDRVLHIANIRQLAWSLYARNDIEAFVNAVLTEECLEVYKHPDYRHVYNTAKDWITEKRIMRTEGYAWPKFEPEAESLT